MLRLLLIDKEFTEVEVEGLSSLHLLTWVIRVDSVVDLVAFTLDVKDERARLSLNPALQVVVICQLILGHERDLDGQV